MKTFDYSALTEPLTADDIKVYRQHRAATKTNSSTITKVVTAIVVIGFFVVFSMLAGRGNFDFSGIVMVGIFMVVVGYFINRMSTRRRAQMFKFASQNGLTYTSGQPPSGQNGMIFGFGNSRTLADRFMLPGGIEAANYHYSTGSGKSRQTHYWGYIRLDLTRQVPHMVLDSTKNNLFGRLSNLPQIFKGAQKLSLEGDFDRHFTLYAPTEYKTDALYVFTPDLMAVLIDAGGEYDIEVVDDKMYIYRYGRGFEFTKRDEWLEIVKIISVIQPKIQRQTKMYSDALVGDRSMNRVAESGQRLKTSGGWLAVVVLVFVVVMIALQFLR